MSFIKIRMWTDESVLETGAVDLEQAVVTIKAHSNYKNWELLYNPDQDIRTEFIDKPKIKNNFATRI